MQEIDAAAKHVEETKQRILSQASLKPEDNIFGAQLGDSFTKAASQQVESLKARRRFRLLMLLKLLQNMKNKKCFRRFEFAYQYNPNDDVNRKCNC